MVEDAVRGWPKHLGRTSRAGKHLTNKFLKEADNLVPIFDNKIMPPKKSQPAKEGGKVTEVVGKQTQYLLMEGDGEEDVDEKHTEMTSMFYANVTSGDKTQGPACTYFKTPNPSSRRWLKFIVKDPEQ